MFLELHIIQNFAPSCLNRDDTNTPKDCMFGGYRRARISSQCLKRAVREYFLRNSDRLGLSGTIGTRTRNFGRKLIDALVEEGKDRVRSTVVSQYIIERTGLKARKGKTSVLLFLGEDEIVRLRDAVLSSWKELNGMGEIKGKSSAKSKAGGPKKKAGRLPDELDAVIETLRTGTKAVDIALFGRMVAELPEFGMDVEAACQVAHAISTNRVSMEMDFFTAVDDFQSEEERGSGMMGFVEYNSSCFYRYSLLDYEQLKANLKDDIELAGSAAAAFVEASVKAVPSGRQSSTAAQNPPDFIRVVLREEGHPFSAANAFLTPAEPNGNKNLVLASIEKMRTYFRALSRMYQDSAANGNEFVSSTYKLEDCETIPMTELIVRVREKLV